MSVWHLPIPFSNKLTPTPYYSQFKAYLWHIAELCEESIGHLCTKM